MAHNPLDPTTNFKTRIFASSKEFGTVEWVPFKAPAGAVVVEDYSTGQILAMATYPTFDNRWQEAGITSEKYQSLFPKSDDPDKSILVNRAIQGQYNMGSSIKPFVAIAAIDAGIITPTSGYNDQGIYTLESLDPKICQNNGGPVRCQFRNATSSGTGKPAVYGPLSVHRRWRSAATRSSTGSASTSSRPTHAGPVVHEVVPPAVRLRYRDRHPAAVRVQRPVPDTPIKQALIKTGKFGKNEVPQLVGRRRRAGGHRPGSALGDAAAGGERLLDAGQRRPADAPSIIKAIYVPLTPNSQTPFMADLSQGTVVQSFETPTVANEVQIDPTPTTRWSPACAV